MGFLFAGRGRRNKRQLVAATYARAIIFSYHYSPAVGATERIQISRRQQGWGLCIGVNKAPQGPRHKIKMWYHRWGQVKRRVYEVCR